MRVAGHAHELDRLAVRGLVPQHDGDVDAARVIAGGGVFLPVALPDHLEEIAVFESLQRLDIVDLLQAEDVGAGRRDGERGQLARVVGMRDRARLLQQPVFGLALDVEERQRPVLVELVAKAGKIEPVHQVLDVEGGEAKRHGRDLCPQASANTRPAAVQAERGRIFVHRAFMLSGSFLTLLLRAFGRRAELFRFLETTMKPHFWSLARSSLVAIGLVTGMATPSLAAPLMPMNQPSSFTTLGISAESIQWRRRHGGNNWSRRQLARQ